MSTTAVRTKDATTDARVGKVDMKLEVVTIPVSDVDRAKAFYGGLGWRLDADFSTSGDHVVQFTPPGSQCSVHFGTNLTSAAPGSAQGLFLIVSDIQAARDELVRRGVKVSEVFHFAGFNRVDPDARVSGPAPDAAQLRVVRVVQRPGRQRLAAAGDHDAAARPDRRRRDGIRLRADLASALRRAAAAHGEHEKRTGGQRDENWPDWYAAYMVAEQAGDGAADMSDSDVERKVSQEINDVW